MLVPLVAATGSLLILGDYLDRKHGIREDLRLLSMLAPANKEIKNQIKAHQTLADYFEETCQNFGNKTALVFEGRKWTFNELNQEANRMAHFLKSRGFKSKDNLAIFMENRPEFLISLLGIAKIGAASALLNINLQGKGLIHCIKISDCKALILAPELTSPIEEIMETLEKEYHKLAYFSFGGYVAFAEHLDPLLKAQPTETLPREVRKGLTGMDNFAFVYTSGTTGLPKAANSRHFRTGMMSVTTKLFMITPDDIIYTAIPIFHSAGLLGVGSMVRLGCTLVLRRKFSATHFFADVAQNDCTVAQYIGELCRYLVNSPPSSYDRQHKLRVMVGNGLKLDIWEQFQNRFQIPCISEFYGATEGMAAFSINVPLSGEGRGSVGKLGLILRTLSPNQIVKFNVETEEPIRGPDGFCIKCKANEPGELLSEIKDEDPLRQFSGYYKNQAGTDKKILRNVFKKGDKYFRTGDLMKFDDKGYFYFVDRIGDTFRWKGENVATTEVAEVMSTFPGVREANVYGVKIEGSEGRAGMAAIILENLKTFDFSGFASHLRKNLAPYAVPIFLRIVPEMDITGTFKHKKNELRDEGFDLTKVKEPIYFLNQAAQTYEPFTQEKFNNFGTIKARL